jgi:UDP:flavonoid glycosyltransferase YjiC (YdhE family)
MQWMYEPAAQRAAREVGLPEHRDRFWSVQRGARLNLALWSRRWRARAADDPPRARIVGFPSPRRAGPLAPEVEAFLASGPAPVVMGLGSALPLRHESLYREVAQACAALGQRALLIGAGAHVARDLGPSVCAVASAPYGAIFPRARVIVHHGGIGSTAEGLRSGKPTLVLSFGNDQHDNAWRVERFGAGLGLPHSKAHGQHLRRALRRCLQSEAMASHARAVADALANDEPGETVAAREIRIAFQ